MMSTGFQTEIKIKMMQAKNKVLENRTHSENKNERNISSIEKKYIYIIITGIYVSIGIRINSTYSGMP